MKEVMVRNVQGIFIPKKDIMDPAKFEYPLYQKLSELSDLCKSSGVRVVFFVGDNSDES